MCKLFLQKTNNLFLTSFSLFQLQRKSGQTILRSKASITSSPLHWPKRQTNSRPRQPTVLKWSFKTTSAKKKTELVKWVPLHSKVFQHFVMGHHHNSCQAPLPLSNVWTRCEWACRLVIAIIETDHHHRDRSSSETDHHHGGQWEQVVHQDLWASFVWSWMASQRHFVFLAIINNNQIVRKMSLRDGREGRFMFGTPYSMLLVPMNFAWSDYHNIVQKKMAFAGHPISCETHLHIRNACRIPFFFI